MLFIRYRSILFIFPPKTQLARRKRTTINCNSSFIQEYASYTARVQIDESIMTYWHEMKTITYAHFWNTSYSEEYIIFLIYIFYPPSFFCHLIAKSYWMWVFVNKTRDRCIVLKKVSQCTITTFLALYLQNM